jgi:nucleoside-triphosphatase THEP1
MSAASARVWQRAAVYGSLWAAVEIVLGSFLHNLRIPFAGSLLAATGVMVMTAGHRAFPERGLIWRAALVCALMKSVSPSAVILGPMVGILMEGVLLEAMVRLSRGRAAGYLVGGALAVSWSMAQRMLNAVLSLGTDVVRLYVDAYAFASRSLGVSSFGPFDLIATLVALEMIAGCSAAALGLRVGRGAQAASTDLPEPGASGTWFPGPPITAEGNWSIPRLVLVAAALVGGMAALGWMPWWAGALYVAAFAAFTLRTYPRALARIRRPSLWIEMAAVMLLAGLVFGGVRHGLSGLLEGVAAGAAMVLRATLVLFGFTAISVELRNPSILARVERHRLVGLSDALGVAFGTLPAFTAALTGDRRLWRSPTLLVATMLQIADRLVRSDSGRHAAQTAVVIVTGPTGSGKTTLTHAVVERLRERGLRVAGILAPGYLAEGRRTGFDIVNLATGERTPLAREQEQVVGPHPRWSRFAFSETGLALGHKALTVDARGADVVIVDEVGPFELSGGGWAGALDELANGFTGGLLLVVRESVVDAVRARWGSAQSVVVHVSSAVPGDIVARLTDAPAPELRHHTPPRPAAAGTP